MQTSSRYNFTIKATTGDGNVFSRAVRPQYSKLALKYTLVEGERYYERKLDNEFSFVGDDFLFIHGMGIRTRFELSVFEGSVKVVEAHFRKGDGKTDVDNGKYTVSVTLYDEFKRIKNGKNDEHDAIEMLKGKEVTANVKVSPLYQLYEYNQVYPKNVTHNFLNGTFTDFDVQGDTIAYERDLFNMESAGATDDGYNSLGRYQNMHFMPTFCKMEVTGGDFTQDTYSNAPTGDNGWEAAYRRNAGKIFLSETSFELLAYSKTIPGNGGKYVKIIMFLPANIVNNDFCDAYYAFEFYNANNELYACSASMRLLYLAYEGRRNFELNPSSFVSEATIHTSTTLEDVDMYVSNTGGSVWPFATITGGFCYQSVFFRALKYQEETTWFLVNNEVDKIAPSSNAYRYGALMTNGARSSVVLSARLSPTENRYGISNGNGYYYYPPTDNEEYQPICIGTWTETRSVWVKGSLLQNLAPIPYYVEPIEDFYELGDLIKSLVGRVDSSIVFEKDTQHSQFLFAANNPVTGLVNNRLLITQKSNLLRLHYDYPAWKGAITFDKLFSMLRNVFNCYYDFFKDDNGKWNLRIEHILYYMNGHSYTPYSRNTINLKQWYDALNGRETAFRTNNWEYATESQASRYEFSWMDNQSDIFDGYPIIIPEEYLIFSDEKTEKRAVELFSTDINFMLATPSEVSSDGFLLAEVVDDGSGTLFVPDVELRDNDRVFVCQNGNLSFVSLHPRYFPFNVYSKIININNGTMATVSLVSRLRRNKISFNKPQGVELSPDMLFKTLTGDGEAKELTVDMTCNKVEAEVYYETETE